MSKNVQDYEMGKGLVPKGATPNKKYEAVVSIPVVTGGAAGDAVPTAAEIAEAGGVLGMRVNDDVPEMVVNGAWKPLGGGSKEVKDVEGGNVVTQQRKVSNGSYVWWEYRSIYTPTDPNALHYLAIDFAIPAYNNVAAHTDRQESIGIGTRTLHVATSKRAQTTGLTTSWYAFPGATVVTILEL